MQGVSAISSVDYWERNARWHQLWAEHGNYHEPIVRQLMHCVQPHWRILDIGAGNGVLSFPLAALGCEVTALEPSAAMRRLFFREAWLRGMGHVRVDDRSWAGTSGYNSGSYDLIIACNSLHVCGEGVMDAFRHMIDMRPGNIFVVTETGADSLIADASRHGYDLRWANEYQTQSPHVYHSLEEAYEHWRFSSELGTTQLDEYRFASRLRLSGNYWYFDETVAVSLLWWDYAD